MDIPTLRYILRQVLEMEDECGWDGGFILCPDTLTIIQIICGTLEKENVTESTTKLEDVEEGGDSIEFSDFFPACRVDNPSPIIQVTKILT